MMDDRDVNREIERVVVGLIGFAMLVAACSRLWDWFSGYDFDLTAWGAIAGRPLMVRGCWDYGLWAICPDGQLAACANIAIIATTILGSVFDWRRLYWLAGAVMVGGYFVNAYLMVKLMETY